MTVNGTTVLAPAPAAVEAVLRVPERLAAALPNVDAAGWETHDDGTFSVTMRPAIALGEVPVVTHWTPVRTDGLAAHYRVDGRSGEHQLEFDVRLVLTDDAGGTRADWALDFIVRGTMRAVGQRVLEAVVAAQARLVLDAIGREAAA